MSKPWTPGWGLSQKSMAQELEDELPQCAVYNKGKDIVIQMTGWEIVLCPDKTFVLVDTTGG